MFVRCEKVKENTFLVGLMGEPTSWATELNPPIPRIGDDVGFRGDVLVGSWSRRYTERPMVSCRHMHKISCCEVKQEVN